MPLVGERIATTTDNFGKMVEEKYLLIDKSLLIKEFIDSTDDALLITRPRRFGKTLNLSMLQHFFAAEVNGNPTKKLFDQFAIAKIDDGKFLQKYQGQYPVIFISFKDIKESSYQAAVNQIKFLIQKLYSKYKDLLKSNNIDEFDRANFEKYLDGSVNNEELQNALEFLSRFLYIAHGKKKVIILIDEYDSPLTSAYEHKFLDDISNFLRNMFSAALKGNEYLEKGLMTGILRVSKNTMLSGLNNLEINTLLDDEYKQYFGFVEEEIEEIIKSTGITQSLDEIKKYYNGYKIGTTVIYNPWSVMKFFDKKELAPYWVSTSNDSLLKDVLLNSNDETKKQLAELMQGKTIEGEIDVNLRYEDLMEKPHTLWTLLLFSGYLTFEAQQRKGSRFTCQLKIPNTEILQQYIEVFSDWLKEKIGKNRYDSFLKSLVEGRMEEFTKSLTGYLFSCTSSHDFQAEVDYHNFFNGLLASITETHYSESNKEYGAGRPDCLLVPIDKSKTQGIVLEFKHTHLDKKQRKDIDNLKFVSHQAATEALEQINMRGYVSAFWKYSQITSVLKIGIAFSNRIVSSACIVAKIVNGEEVKNQATTTPTFYDADETEYSKPKPTPETRVNNTKINKRRIINDDDLSDDTEIKQPPLKKQKVENTKLTTTSHSISDFSGQSIFTSSKTNKNSIVISDNQTTENTNKNNNNAP